MTDRDDRDDRRTAAISENPATGARIARYPFQDAASIERTLAAARDGFVAWRDTPIATRAAAYRRLATLLREGVEPFAALITAEMGKTLAGARAEINKCAAAIDWYAEHGPAMLADEPVLLDADGSEGRAHLSFLPIGTVLGVMPWNLPFWQTVRAAAPILLSGNGFLLKHAPNVTGCAFAIGRAFAASGFPPGAFSVLNADDDAVSGVLGDPRIAAVTLTGSGRAGAAVAARAGALRKKSLLELGGADPFLVLADANLDAAVAAAIRSRFDNAGQVCIAAKRLILERPIADAFTARFVAAAGRLRTGDPTRDDTDFGPIAREDLRAALHDQVRRSVAAGARLLAGGAPVAGPGWFYPPTVLAGVAPGMPAFDEEVFGPVAALTVADDRAQAIALANRSGYGLSAALWTADLDAVPAIARRLETGAVFVNGTSASDPRVPIGGVKDSGYGRELSRFGLHEFANVQTVWTRPSPS